MHGLTAQPGNFVSLDGIRRRSRERLRLRCYPAALSFGFSRSAGGIRVAIDGLEVLGLVTLREPEFDTISAAIYFAGAVIQAVAGLRQKSR